MLNTVICVLLGYILVHDIGGLDVGSNREVLYGYGVNYLQGDRVRKSADISLVEVEKRVQGGFVGEEMSRKKRAPDPNRYGLTFDEIVAIIRKHNEYRALEEAFDIQQMLWDNELAVLAQQWADLCIYGHTPPEYYDEALGSVGQNLYAIGGGVADWDPLKGLGKWYDEKQFYDITDLSCEMGEQCGHYTQIVWATTLSVGCGLNYCAEQNGYYLVCDYSPAGNYRGVAPHQSSDFDLLCDMCIVQELDCLENAYCYNADCEGKMCSNGGLLIQDVCQCNCTGTGYKGEFCYDVVMTTGTGKSE